MKCFVEGREVPGGAIGPPAMNFGQHWRWGGCRRCQYRYLIPADEFFRRVAGPFDQVRREVAEDMDQLPEDWQEPPFVRLRELGFPPLSVLLAAHPEVLSGLMLWLDLCLLNWLDEGGGGAGAHYSANSLDSFVAGDGHVEIQGVAYETAADDPAPAPPGRRKGEGEKGEKEERLLSPALPEPSRTP